MRIFRDHNDKPNIDLGRLSENLAKLRERQVELERTVARLNQDMPGNAEAIAAAGIAFRASINRSASMIELGTAAVEALRMAGYAITPPLAARQSLTPHHVHIESQPRDGVPAAERENKYGQPPIGEPIPQTNSDRAARQRGIPDDWAQ